MPLANLSVNVFIGVREIFEAFLISSTTVLLRFYVLEVDLLFILFCCSWIFLSKHSHLTIVSLICHSGILSAQVLS